jgi:virginiamycin B lyase
MAAMLLVPVMSLVCALLPGAGLAQGRLPAPGSLTGKVLGPDEKAVAGARIILQASYGHNPRTAQTDATGRFRFPSLRPGLHDLRAQAKGRWSDREHNVLVRSSQQTSVTLRLLLQQPPAAELQGHVREWTVPVENSLPHDPAVDPQGNIWLTLQRANQVARLNPETGEWKIFHAPTPNSGPHGLVADADGNIWFTENSAGKIGRVDARTGQVTEYAAPTAQDPHTPIFGPDGALWFTAQSSNLVVRMDTKTGTMREFRVPTPNARPYGIVVGPGGALWFCEFGVNKLARLDPKTGSITEYEAPLADTRPRRLAVVDNAIYYTDFRTGRLGRLDLARMSFRDWPSPSGPASHPYGIAADASGQLWYNEFSANQLVRFNPQTQTFHRFPLPSARSEVRHMVRDARGRIWMALSGANKVAVVE